MPQKVKLEPTDNKTAREKERSVGKRLVQRICDDKDNVVAAALRECADILAGAHNRVFMASPFLRNRSASLGCLPRNLLQRLKAMLCDRDHIHLKGEKRCESCQKYKRKVPDDLVVWPCIVAQGESRCTCCIVMNSRCRIRKDIPFPWEVYSD